MTDAVLVVGGGIGGLVVARALARAGIEVEVLERAPELRAVGAGITLGANAMRVLAGLGRREAVAARGRALGNAAIIDARGRTLSADDLGALAAKYGEGYAIHRGALHEALADGLAQSDAVQVRCGTSVRAIAVQGERVEVELDDGGSRRPRALVGADGLHSTVRTLVFGANAPVYAGYTCWRWTGRVPGGLAGASEAWGRGVRAGLVPLPGEDVYAFFVANAPAGTPGDPALGRVAAVRERFTGFAGEVPRVLAAMGSDDDPVLHHDIEEIEQRPWTMGPVALLGDAAHAMTPNFGQGAAMAIEDAIVLARELAAGGDVVAALRRFEERRRPRVESLQRGARRLGQIAQWQSPIATWARDLALRLAPAASARKTVESIVAYDP